MKFKHLLATLLGVAVINVAVAGPYCAPPSASDKCPVECCPDSPGYVGVSYMSDTSSVVFAILVIPLAHMPATPSTTVSYL